MGTLRQAKLIVNEVVHFKKQRQNKEEVEEQRRSGGCIENTAHKNTWKQSNLKKCVLIRLCI